MDEMNESTISDWMKVNHGLSEACERLGKTRPTIYKFMELYDNGNRDALPEDVRAYFDSKLSDIDPSSMLKIQIKNRQRALSLTQELDSVQAEISLLKRDLESLETIYKDLLQKDSDSRELSKVQRHIGDVKHRINSLEVRSDELRRQIKEQLEKIKRLENSEPVPEVTSDSSGIINTACYIEGSRCMVVHDGDDDDCRYMLELYVKMGSDYVEIADYYAENDSPSTQEPGGDEMEDFFMIDNVLLSAPLFYEVIQWKCNGDEFVERTGKTSGKCQLKDSRSN